jgi:hypothetical protein
MRKAILLEVRLWVEGEAEAAADFAALTTRAVREIVAAGADTHPELKVRVRSVREARDDDETRRRE